MVNDKKLWEICVEIYTKMYAEATPSADFDKLISSGEGKKPEWFLNYYLDRKRQEEIFDEIVKKHHLNKRDEHAVSKEVWLGCSPTAVKKEVK